MGVHVHWVPSDTVMTSGLRGIGLEFVKQILSKGSSVVATVRGSPPTAILGLQVHSVRKSSYAACIPVALLFLPASSSCVSTLLQPKKESAVLLADIDGMPCGASTRGRPKWGGDLRCWTWM